MDTQRMSEAENSAFDHKRNQFYIQCARHVLNLAPLPEFKDVIALLEMYDAEPSDENRADLEAAYNALVDERTRREYGYTAVGEFYSGLVHILECVLFSPDSVWSSSVQYFTEACWYAGRAIRCGSHPRDDFAGRAQHGEYKWQDALWKQIFDSEEKQ